MTSKKSFIKQLQKILQAALPNEISKLTLVDDNYVEIKYMNGYSRKVCIECDSHIAIIKDVLKVV